LGFYRAFRLVATWGDFDQPKRFSATYAKSELGAQRPAKGSPHKVRIERLRLQSPGQLRFLLVAALPVLILFGPD